MITVPRSTWENIFEINIVPQFVVDCRTDFGEKVAEEQV